MKLSVVFLLAVCIASCDGKRNGEQTAGAQALTIASWNVQALFDGEERGNEYKEYSSDAGWNKEKYQTRLTAIAGAINQMVEGGPDMLALIEIENAQVIGDLLAGSLAQSGYRWTFFGTNPGYSLGLGIISKVPFTQTRLHSMNTAGEVIPRPIVEVRINKDDHPVVLFICHWKSKLNGETEYLRRAAARVLRRRIREIESEDPSIPVLIMGDLNENYDEFYRNNGAIVTALLPDDPDAAEKVSQDSGRAADFLVISNCKPPIPQYFDSDFALYSPWGNELSDGSYSYKNQWETIDHILLSSAFFDDAGWDFTACSVINKAPFANQAGFPFMYNARTGNGLSDHLPLLLKLGIKNRPDL
ncbi:MAG: endonuclease/exonuclease/phosphatase family protein [Spirochaetaceae bacterium]|jgi:endonuclease/exonuclease/phosphatase family metal-dependent hydrolase|nr:endonuclease/exonuclease/phosphatase family protein [Spirochaetaceae bacterium]